MRLLKSKLFIIFISSIIIFNTFAFAGVFLSLPERVSVSPEKADGSWIPSGISWLVKLKNTSASPAMENSAKSINGQSSNFETTVCLYGFLPVKTVDVSVKEKFYLVPGGENIGINLKTEGLLVVGITEFKSGGKKVSPGESCGIRTGDIITEINGVRIKKIKELQELAETADKHQITGYRRDKKMTWILSPEICDETGKPKLGLWVRESVAGIGTVTFYTDTHFGALGHPISDIDTGKCVIPDGGSICKSKIIGVDKGEKGKPGSLKGVFLGDECGKIIANTNCGVFGTITQTPTVEKIPVGCEGDVTCGEALIRCDIGSGTENFTVNITGITRGATSQKTMVIKITDQKLLDKTGGIVQGMSGSPIVQNGKLIGAVTHVFVNDPTRGYGIFIENMLSEAEEIK